VRLPENISRVKTSMSLQVLFHKKDDWKSKLLPGFELNPGNRVYKHLGNKDHQSFMRENGDGHRVRVWTCSGHTKNGKKCRYLGLSSSHLKEHKKNNHDIFDPLTLPENDVVVKEPSSKRHYVMKNGRKSDKNKTYEGEKPDQMVKFQDMYVPRSPCGDVPASGGIEEDFFYDESGMSQASTTDTTPNKNDSRLGLHPFVLKSALEQIGENSFVQSLFAE